MKKILLGVITLASMQNASGYDQAFEEGRLARLVMGTVAVERMEEVVGVGTLYLPVLVGTPGMVKFSRFTLSLVMRMASVIHRA